MGKTEGAVKALQFRALDSLQRFLTEDALRSSVITGETHGSGRTGDRRRRVHNRRSASGSGASGGRRQIGLGPAERAADQPLPGQLHRSPTVGTRVLP